MKKINFKSEKKIHLKGRGGENFPSKSQTK